MLKYIPLLKDYTGFTEMPAPILSVTTPATYRVLRSALVSRRAFLQSELAKSANASASHANRVVKWLADRRHVERLRDGRYQIRGAAALVNSVFPYQRTMKQALAASLSVRGNKKQMTEAIVKAGGILCLESAIEEHSRFFRADRICVYHADPEELVQELAPDEGGILPVQVYVADIPLEGDVEENRRTTKFRTVIDLACDGRVYAAKELLEELWGVIVE